MISGTLHVNLKPLYLKFCSAHQSRVRIALADYRVIPEDECQETTAKVKGMILNWRSRTAMSKQQTSEMILEAIGAAIPGASQKALLGAVE